MMEQLVQDIRYAIRSLLRQPGFAVMAVATLALGVGAATAIFSVFHGVLLKPLPFEDPDRVVAVSIRNTETGTRGQNSSAPDFHDWKAESRSFEVLAYFQGGETSVTRRGTAQYAMAYSVTPGFFEALGATAAAGRLLTEDDHRRGAPEAAVLAHGYWMREFSGSADAIGASLKFRDTTFTVVGVLPEGLAYPGRADIYYPSWLVEETTSRSGHNYRVIGRLRRDVSLRQADEEMSAIAARLAERYPDSNRSKGVVLVPLQEQVVGSSRQTLWILMGAVGVVLLVACANVANLLLARSAARVREMVVRAAVGAGRGRLIRQLLTESAVLGVAAALLGAWLARLGVVALVALAPDTLPRAGELGVDMLALGFALAIAVAASLVFGLAPAMRLSAVQLARALRQSGKGSSAGGSRVRSGFVVAQVALAVVLVMAAALLGRSLAALNAVDMGFESDKLLVLRTQVPVASVEDVPRAIAFYRNLLAEIRRMPGIQSASAVTSVPTLVRSSGSYWIDGVVKDVDGPIPRATGDALLNVVAPHYFQTMGSSVLAGRDFRDTDTADAPMVAIVNESLAREAFANQDPIGRLIQCGLDSLEPMLIVGVTRDIRTLGPAANARAEIYMPFEQHPRPSTALNLVVRTATSDPLAPVEPIRRLINSANPDVPVRATTMEGTLETATAAPRFRTYLLVVFAAVALILALAGVYGVMAYTISQRVPELGVRIALGASPSSIMALVLRQGATLALLGLGIGIGLAMLSGRLLEGVLFGITSRDPLTLVIVAAGVGIGALAACYLPGRRAVRVDPMEALRAE